MHVTGILILFLLLTINLSLIARDNAKLIEHIMYQEFDKAKELINSGADVNYQDESSGSTALTKACTGILMNKVPLAVVKKAA